MYDQIGAVAAAVLTAFYIIGALVMLVVFVLLVAGVVW